MATIFPDVEKLVVAVIRDGLDAMSDPFFSDVVVATIKPAADVKPYPSKVVTVRGDGGTALERDITRLERVGVNVYANTYANASEIARTVESIVRAARPDGVKLVSTTLSPIRVDTPSTTAPEQRYMTFELTVKAVDIIPPN